MPPKTVLRPLDTNGQSKHDRPGRTGRSLESHVTRPRFNCSRSQPRRIRWLGKTLMEDGCIRSVDHRASFDVPRIWGVGEESRPGMDVEIVHLRRHIRASSKERAQLQNRSSCSCRSCRSRIKARNFQAARQQGNTCNEVFFDFRLGRSNVVLWIPHRDRHCLLSQKAKFRSPLRHLLIWQVDRAPFAGSALRVWQRPGLAFLDCMPLSGGNSKQKGDHASAIFFCIFLSAANKVVLGRAAAKTDRPHAASPHRLCGQDFVAVQLKLC